MSRKIYFGGPILTSDDEHRTAFAVITENSRITDVIYDESTDIAALFPDAEKHDLHGATLTAGFIDGHSHFISGIFEDRMLNANTSPLGESDSVDQLIASLKKQLEDPRFDGEEYLYARGYDESVYPDHRLPTRLDLDTVTSRPLALTHISGHNTVFNSAALNAAGVDDSYVPPADGDAGRLPDGSLSGIFYENAVHDVRPKSRRNAEKDIRDGIERGLLKYISEGVTTAQDGGTSAEVFDIMQSLGNSGKLSIDIVSYLIGENTSERLANAENHRYHGHYRAAGRKIFLDGSPQAKTAWLSKPYKKTLAGKDEEYRGSGIYTDERLREIISESAENGWQINVHTNGDEAIEQLIRVVGEVQEKYPGWKNSRPVSIHCQTVRSDQLDRMKASGIIASFFVDHVFYWGDYHVSEILGEERASRISPLAEALKKGVSFSIHQDSPVTKQSPIFAIHNAVNRTTRSGRILGSEYRISPWEALKAVTINSAYQLFEENEKGSITAGKIADLVILDGNILTVSPEKIKDIKVIETIKDGETVYNRKQVQS